MFNSQINKVAYQKEVVKVLNVKCLVSASQIFSSKDRID